MNRKYLTSALIWESLSLQNNKKQFKSIYLVIDLKLIRLITAFLVVMFAHNLCLAATPWEVAFSKTMVVSDSSGDGEEALKALLSTLKALNDTAKVQNAQLLILAIDGFLNGLEERPAGETEQLRVILNDEEHVKSIRKINNGLQNIMKAAPTKRAAVVKQFLEDKSTKAALSDVLYVFDEYEEFDINLIMRTLRDLTSNKAKEISFETEVKYSSKEDEIHYDFQKQVMLIKGGAAISFGEKSLEAQEIAVAWATNTVKAYGVPDSTGEVKGLPIFKEGAQRFDADEMVYNYKTQKGLIKGIVTEQGDGLIQSKLVKKMPDSELYMKNSIYTTCRLETPHFGIRASKLKVVPNKYIISGPFHVEFNSVPLPLGFPLALFPASNTRSSGLIVPQYGEAADRGFFLRNGGFYWAMNDYVGVKLLGEIYTLGGWGATLDANYNKRYYFNGMFQLSHRKVVFRNNDFTERSSEDYRVVWTHNPITKRSGRFSANVQVASNGYNRNNSLNIQSFLAPAFNSNITYAKTFEGTPFSFGASVRHNQNVRTNQGNTTASVTFSVNRINPFRTATTTKKNALTELNFTYNVDAGAEITNSKASRTFPFTVANQRTTNSNVVSSDTQSSTSTILASDTLPSYFSNFSTYLKDADFGVLHRIPVSTNMSFFKYFTFSPSFNYQEYWYTKRYNYTWLDEAKAVKVDTTSGFTRLYDFNTSASLNTRLYMFYNMIGGATIRHMITPRLSGSWRPDFADPTFNFYQSIQTSETGAAQRVAIAYGGRSGVPSAGRNASIAFGLDNQLEMKYRSKNDSSGEVAYKKVMLLQNVSVNSGYNFLADSMNLSNFSFAARTNIKQKIDLNFTSSFDPYSWVPTRTDESSGKVLAQRRSKEFLIDSDGRFVQMTSATLAIGTRFAAKKTTGKPIAAAKPSTAEENRILEDIKRNPNMYVDFNIPWTLNFDYSIRYTKDGFFASTLLQTFNVNGEVKLTPKWRVGFRTGYDFQNDAFSFTSIDVHRDLHCWQMALNWVPFGPRQSYTVDIHVKSSLLQDLRINKRNTWYDRAQRF